MHRVKYECGYNENIKCKSAEATVQLTRFEKKSAILENADIKG